MNDNTFEVTSRSSEYVKPINAVLACRRRLILLGLKAMLESYPQVNLVGTAVIPDALYAHLSRNSVDVLLCAWREYGDYARPTLEAVRADYPDLRICVISENADPVIIRDAFSLGATGFISEACNDDQVIDALVSVANGRTAIETGSRHANRSVAPEDLIDLSVLSDREREILTMLAVGLTTKEIAVALFLSPKTVETHRANTMRKLEITSVAEAVMYAHRMGLVAVEPDN